MKFPRIDPNEQPNKGTPRRIYLDMSGKPINQPLPSNPSVIPPPDGPLTASRTIPPNR